MLRNNFLTTLVGILVVVLIAGGIYWWFRSHRTNPTVSNERQAVFLTNGQVYFGHLTNTNDKFVVLSDVYYLQQDRSQLQSGDTNQKQVNLIKLGNELHGPEDTIYINRNQVLFFENMKNNSKVNDAINNFVNSGSQTTK